MCCFSLLFCLHIPSCTHWWLLGELVARYPLVKGGPVAVRRVPACLCPGSMHLLLLLALSCPRQARGAWPHPKSFKSPQSVLPHCKVIGAKVTEKGLYFSAVVIYQQDRIICSLPSSGAAQEGRGRNPCRFWGQVPAVPFCPRHGSCRICSVHRGLVKLKLS